MEKKTSTRRRKSTREGKKLYLDERLYGEAQKVAEKMGVKISKFTEMLYLQAIYSDKLVTVIQKFSEELEAKYPEGIPTEEYQEVFLDFLENMGKEIDKQMQFAAGLFAGTGTGDYMPTLERKDYKDLMMEAFQDMAKVTSLLELEEEQESTEKPEEKEEERSAQASPEGEHAFCALPLGDFQLTRQ